MARWFCPQTSTPRWWGGLRTTTTRDRAKMWGSAKRRRRAIRGQPSRTWSLKVEQIRGLLLHRETVMKIWLAIRERQRIRDLLWTRLEGAPTKESHQGRAQTGPRISTTRWHTCSSRTTVLTAYRIKLSKWIKATSLIRHCKRLKISLRRSHAKWKLRFQSSSRRMLSPVQWLTINSQIS